MTKFFFELTKRNWGCPYHVILADIGTIILLFILFHFKPPMPFLWHAILIWLIMNAIGYINELYQAEQGRGFWEDIIGNNCGIILGVLKVWFIQLI